MRYLIEKYTFNREGYMLDFGCITCFEHEIFHREGYKLWKEVWDGVRDGTVRYAVLLFTLVWQKEKGNKKRRRGGSRKRTFILRRERDDVRGKGVKGLGQVDKRSGGIYIHVPFAILASTSIELSDQVIPEGEH
jgi:hypothetical protein